MPHGVNKKRGVPDGSYERRYGLRIPVGETSELSDLEHTLELELGAEKYWLFLVSLGTKVSDLEYRRKALQDKLYDLHHEDEDKSFIEHNQDISDLRRF